VSSLATIELDAPGVATPGHDPDYIPLIVRAMEAQDMGIRQMSLRTNIKKSRLGVILHRNPAKRAAMTLPEFQSILRSLNIDLMHAIISVEMASDLKLMDDERFATLVAMLSTLFKGSEIRKEWGTHFQSAVIKKMVGEISRILQRRAAFEEDLTL
jgi:hypothetical protein